MERGWEQEKNPKDEHAKEWMERYIYQVVRRLPKKQRGEVSMELRELISDMLEQEEAIEAVLEKLGDPAEFAAQYQDGANSLIGPEYFDTYTWLLKIVLPCAMIPIFIVGCIGAKGFEEIYEALFETLTGGITAFGSVTLAVAIMERQKVRLEKERKKTWRAEELEGEAPGRILGWTPQSLSPVPLKKARISRSDCVVEIVFTVLFAVLLIFAPHFFGVIFAGEERTAVVPFFNLPQWHRILPLFILSLAVGMIDDIVKLAVGVYGKTVLVSNLLCNGISLVLSVLLLKALPFWNPDFTAELQKTFAQAEEIGWFARHWNTELMSNLLLGIILFAVILDCGTTIYKTVRYGAVCSVPG